MFLVDDLLLAPGKAAYALFQELARKAQEEWLNDDGLKQELQQLYEMFEGGRISDKDFEAREGRLLERLEQIARIKFQAKWGTQEEVQPLPALPPPAPPESARARMLLPPSPLLMSPPPPPPPSPTPPPAPSQPPAPAPM